MYHNLIYKIYISVNLLLDFCLISNEYLIIQNIHIISYLCYFIKKKPIFINLIFNIFNIFLNLCLYLYYFQFLIILEAFSLKLIFKFFVNINKYI